MCSRDSKRLISKFGQSVPLHSWSGRHAQQFFNCGRDIDAADRIEHAVVDFRAGSVLDGAHVEQLRVVAVRPVKVWKR